MNGCSRCSRRLRRHQFDLGARQVAVGGHEEQVVDGGRQDEGVRIGVLASQGVVDRAAGGGGPLRPTPLVRLRLRIDIDEEDALLRHGQGSRQIDGRCGLGDAAFLVGDCNDARKFCHLV